MKMKVGTKSLLFGHHQFILHPIVVTIAWIKLFGTLPSFKEFVCIVIHDWGYWGKPNMDGDEGGKHPEWAANFARKWLDHSNCWDEFCRCDHHYNLCLLHSRHYAKEQGLQPSSLCWADKYSITYLPWWVAIPLAWLSGELTEYREKSISTTPLSSSHREWFKNIKAIMIKVALERNGAAAPYMDKEKPRVKWNKEYTKIMVDRTGLDFLTARYVAEQSDDSFNDGDTPADAVDTELSYWEE